DLALVPYLLADCLIRLAAVKADDPPTIARLEKQLKGAVEQLDLFVGSQPNSPEAPDALLKLELCHQRLAANAAQPPERIKMLATARAAYERLIQQFPKHDHVPQAMFERAKCLAQTGDLSGAITELKRFTADPLKTSSAAPLAVLELATLLRAQDKPGEAADALAGCRSLHEPKLSADPARAGWVPLLQYHHGVALKEAGKFGEARTVFQGVIDKFPDRPEAVEAAVRVGQCFLDEGLQKQEAPRKKLATPNLKPEEITAATTALNEGAKLIRLALEFL